MADDNETIPEEVERGIERSVGNEPKVKEKKGKERSYQIIGDSRIPVAKSHGQVWKSRRDIVLSDMKEAYECWDEAIKYYNHDQMKHRVSSGDGASTGNAAGSQRLNNSVTETENIVYSNVTTLVPALYARNPKAEFTSTTEIGKDKARTTERLVNVIGNKKSVPGVNLKPKAKRCVVTSLLTNRSWLEIGWVFKNDSNEKALDDLRELADKLTKAKTPKDIEEIEGQIMALESTIDILQPSGPFVKYKHPKQVLVDPNSKEIDLSDANWIMVEDYLPSQYLAARFGKKNKDNEDIQSIYKPTHVLKLNRSEVDDESADMGDDYNIFQKEKSYDDFGFEDKASFEKAQMTQVWFVWDKVTRRVYMYNGGDWSWPIWVWDDPYNLDTFFPLFPLSFHEGVDGTAKKGEVTYYLDQQDAINEIVDEQARARKWARRNIFYNKNLVGQTDVETVLTGPDGTARGLDLPPDMKLSDVIGSVPPPSVQFQELFNKEDKYRAIDRISSVGETLRGAQFKANTTNDAVQANVAASNMRTEEKTDQIEDWMGQVYWGLAQLCLQFMNKDQVAALVGEEVAKDWEPMTPQQIANQMSVTVVGGTSKKPTSMAKKEEAIEVGQVLGQFANVSPYVIIVALELLQQAFDEIVIKEEHWDMILEHINGQVDGQQQQQVAQQGQQVPPQAAQQQDSSAGNIDELLKAMPIEMKRKVAEAIQSGEPPQQVIADAQRMLNEAAGQPVQ